MKLQTLWFLLALTIPCVGQTFPGLQFVQPDPTNGSPLLVATPCAEASSLDDRTWVAPILVFEDSMQAMFVDNNCLTAAVQLGFGQDGKYMVAIYTQYKGSEYPCKYLFGKESSTDAEFQRECKMIGYRVRRINVDTRAKKMIVLHVTFVDLKGFHAFDVKAAKDWTQFSELEKDPLSRSTLAAIEHTTKLVEKELDYWNYRYKQLSPPKAH